MASTSTSGPLRPSQAPSRHSISTSASPSDRLKNGAPPPSSRTHQPIPTRAKLKHAATAPSASALTNTVSYACHHCHQMDTRFYCEPCLASRVQAHHTEMRRLGLARDKAKASVSQLLFDSSSSSLDEPLFASLSQPTQIHTINENALPDPFDINVPEPSSSSDASHPLVLHSLIQLRAQQATVRSRVQSIHQCISESQHAHLQGQEALKEKLAHIALRKQNLAKAWSALEGSSAPASASAAQRSRIAAKSRWLTHPAADHIDVPLVYTDVYTHYERQSDDSSNATPLAADSTQHQLGAILTRARADLASLQTEGVAVSAQLAATRAALARQAFTLYSVSPPDAPSSKLAQPSRTRPLDLSASSSVAQRISRLSERYIPGAFGMGPSNSPSTPVHVRSPHHDAISAARPPRASPAPSSTPSSSNNWTITSLPLPLPSDARRYPRENVNGAVTYAANLIQLVAAYLGVALPFSIEQHKGRLAIRPDPLWDGGGGSSAKHLYLSSSAYTHLTASPSPAARPSKLNNLAESTYGLGASTLSTIESYIHLSSGAALPWGLSSTAVHSSKAGSGPVNTDADTDQHRRSETEARSTSKAKPDQAAKSFVSALVMLCYNVAYLATKQGIKLDLVAAAANPLELLSRTMQQAELGRLAHANCIRPSSIQDLSLTSLDYEQLAQILEPNNAAADTYQRGVSKNNSHKAATTPRQSLSKPTKLPAKILEQSYVDVGEAAASVLDIKDPGSQPAAVRTPLKRTEKHPELSAARRGTRTDTVSNLQKQRVGADTRLGSPTPPQPPPSLDFLRQRGRDASQAKDAPSSRDALSNRDASHRSNASHTVPTKVGPGAVIFNGVEVGVGNLSSPESARGLGPKARNLPADEGWDLV
ncbi:hypothetical protein EX895_002755 [Sporisorium graminicola]|uniref:Autophagy-related protein 14 n=1 Tax=Sporisorium graminicola TaxID=280036 RepID=A0A4U7KV28_9BASI|nr:hypothetical protein EX895_002755 [Sporisorium graminicola]TKY88403.1 hypothetical protein EX895_002755 [Sporisorium graminicola]